MDGLFKGRHFDQEIIVLWYLRYKLSFHDLVEMMAERGISLAHTTIMRWIQSYVPEFEKRWSRFARPAGRSWRVDETYVKIRGRWTYLYRAVDKEGNTVDFLLRAKRDVAAAKAFFRRALQRQSQLPHKITLDGYQASHRGPAEALSEHPEGNQCKIRSSKYVNNLIEQALIDQAAAWSDARPQAFSKSRDDHRRHRTHAPDQKGSVQTRQASRQTQNRSRDLEW